MLYRYRLDLQEEALKSFSLFFFFSHPFSHLFSHPAWLCVDDPMGFTGFPL